MNNLRIEEVKKQKIRKTKADVVRLRTLWEQEQNPDVKGKIYEELKKARFYHDVMETPMLSGCALERIHKEEVEANARLRKRIKWAVFVVSIAVLLAILFLSQGCTASIGGGASASAYYPKTWESPASRKQHTQPTMGMARNNLPMVGGAE